MTDMAVTSGVRCGIERLTARDQMAMLCEEAPRLQLVRAVQRLEQPSQLMIGNEARYALRCLMHLCVASHLMDARKNIYL